MAANGNNGENKKKADIPGGYVMVCLETNETFVIKKLASLDRPVEYLKNYFNKDRPVPEIHYQHYIDDHVSTTRTYAYGFLIGLDSTVESILTYLATMLDTITDNLDEDWTTYGNTFKKGKFKASQLVKLVPNKINRPSSGQTNVQDTVGEEEDGFMLAMILGVYRYQRTHEAQKDIIMKRVEALANSYRHSPKIVASVKKCNKLAAKLVSHRAFEQMAATFDMFFEKFPNHQYAKARFGSIILRHQACSGYLDLVFFSKTLGCPSVSKALEWFFCNALAREIEQMVIDDPDEEISNTHSYFPYLDSMHLVKRSPYSAAANPAIHLLTHAVGTLMGITRSKNAIALTEKSTFNLASNIALVYLGNKQNPDGVKASKRPMDILTLFQDGGNAFSEDEVKSLNQAVRSVGVVRDGTVGKWVKESFLSLLPVQKKSL